MELMTTSIRDLARSGPRVLLASWTAPCLMPSATEPPAVVVALTREP